MKRLLTAFDAASAAFCLAFSSAVFFAASVAASAAELRISPEFPETLLTASERAAAVLRLFCAAFKLSFAELTVCYAEFSASDAVLRVDEAVPAVVDTGLSASATCFDPSTACLVVVMV